MTTPHPLLMRPILMPKVWGGRRLERLGKTLPTAEPYGESWEVADLASTSPSGGGGQAARSVIATGPLAGRTLGDAMALWGTGLVGAGRPASGGGFPLLVKYLDARENLSVQVHPSAAYAAAHPGAHLKTECWYIIHADPGAVIYKGLRPGVTRDRLAAGARDGSIVSDLVAVPAVPGQMHDLPSGTCHALGAGILVAEVQTPSDTTFRLYDWGRTGRELHLEAALACVSTDPPPRTTSLPAGADRARLVTTPFFSVDELRPRAGSAHPIWPEGGCVTLMVVAGAGELQGPFDPVRLSAGQTVVVPAACSRGAALAAEAADMVALCSNITPGR